MFFRQKVNQPPMKPEDNMKKLSTLFLVLLMIPQLCFASQAKELKTIMDEYHYFITVEWDQEDNRAFEDQTKIYENKIDDLISKGLSIKDLGQIPQELKNLNHNDREIIMRSLKEEGLYSKGASWNGEVLAPAIMLGIVAIALFAFIRYAAKKNRAFDECVANHGGDEQSCIDR